MFFKEFLLKLTFIYLENIIENTKTKYKYNANPQIYLF